MQCQCITGKGTQCSRKAKAPSNFCYQHQDCKQLVSSSRAASTASTRAPSAASTASTRTASTSTSPRGPAGHISWEEREKRSPAYPNYQKFLQQLRAHGITEEVPFQSYLSLYNYAISDFNDEHQEDTNLEEYYGEGSEELYKYLEKAAYNYGILTRPAPSPAKTTARAPGRSREAESERNLDTINSVSWSLGNDPKDVYLNETKLALNELRGLRLAEGNIKIRWFNPDGEEEELTTAGDLHSIFAAIDGRLLDEGVDVRRMGHTYFEGVNEVEPGVWEIIFG